MPRRANAGDWLALLALTVLWGSAFLFNELALASYSPAALVCGRVAIGAAAMWVFMRASGIRLPKTLSGWRPMAVMAVLGNLLPFQLVAWAQQHIDSAKAGVLMAIMPLFILTLAHFFVPGARLTVHKSLGFLIGFVGVIFVIGPDATAGLQNNVSLWSAVAVLGAAFSYAINSIYARRLGAANPVQLSSGMLIVASLLSIPYIAVSPGAITAPTIAATLSLVILGLLSTGFATVLYFRLIQGPGPTFLSLVNYLVPGWAVLAGAWLLGESLETSVYVGLALILSGIAVSEALPGIHQQLRARLGSVPRPAVSPVATDEA